MEKITLTVPASRVVSGRALAGVVGSGDMEVLFTADPSQTLTIEITTSVDNSRSRWEALFNRLQTVSSLPGWDADDPRFWCHTWRGAHSYRTGF